MHRETPSKALHLQQFLTIDATCPTLQRSTPVLPSHKESSIPIGKETFYIRLLNEYRNSPTMNSVPETIYRDQRNFRQANEIRQFTINFTGHLKQAHCHPHPHFVWTKIHGATYYSKDSKSAFMRYLLRII